VSIEVSPKLAYDADGTIADARRLSAAVNRPNLLVKVPATREGLPAIRQLLSEGINVNITLMFSMEHYEAVAEAYVAALEDRAQHGLPLGGVASVASFFVSRVDTLADKLLEEKMRTEGPDAPGQRRCAARLPSQQQAGVPAIHRDLQASGSRRWRLKAPASSGCSGEHDTRTRPTAISFMETLIGPDTINTLPDETIVAFLDMAGALLTVEEGVEGGASSVQDAGRCGD
jgi:transaldolase